MKKTLSFFVALLVSMSVFSQNVIDSLKVSIDGYVFYMMRVESGETKYYNDNSIETLRLDKPYYIMKYEVTEELWSKVMEPRATIFNPERAKGGVSYNDALKFVEKINEKSKFTFSLPDEEQWMYAAAGGAKAKKIYTYSGGDPKEVGYWKENSNGMIHNVGEKKANALGIHDMSGNVREWCQGGITKGGSYDVSCSAGFDIHLKIDFVKEKGPSASRKAQGLRLVISDIGPVDIKLDKNYLSFGNLAGETEKVKVEVNRYEYSVTCSDTSWLEVKKIDDGAITVKCKDRNPKAISRTATISINCESVAKSITVKQDPKPLSCNFNSEKEKDRKNISGEHNTKVPLGVNVNVDDYQVIVPSWCRYEKQEGLLLVLCDSNVVAERTGKIIIKATVGNVSKMDSATITQNKRESLVIVMDKKNDTIHHWSQNILSGIDYYGTCKLVFKKGKDSWYSNKVEYNRNNQPVRMRMKIKRNYTIHDRTLVDTLMAGYREIPIKVVQKHTNMTGCYLNPMFGYDFGNKDYLVGLSISDIPGSNEKWESKGIENPIGFRIAAYYLIGEKTIAPALGLNVRTTRPRSPLDVQLYAAAGPTFDIDDKEVGPIVDAGVRLAFNRNREKKKNGDDFHTRFSWIDLTFGCVYMCDTFIPTIGLGWGFGLGAGVATGLGFLIKSIAD